MFECFWFCIFVSFWTWVCWKTISMCVFVSFSALESPSTSFQLPYTLRGPSYRRRSKTWWNIRPTIFQGNRHHLLYIFSHLCFLLWDCFQFIIFIFCIFDTDLFCDCSIPGVIMQAGKLRIALWPACVPVILLCEVWSHNPCLFKKIISSSAVFQGSISDGLYNVLKLIRTSVQPWPWYHPFHIFRYSSHFEKNVLLGEI